MCKVIGLGDLRVHKTIMLVLCANWVVCLCHAAPGLYDGINRGNGIWLNAEVVSTESTGDSNWSIIDVGPDGKIHVTWSDGTDYKGCGFDDDIVVIDKYILFAKDP